MITQAAANNAGWCASMCRAHDIESSFDGRVWRSSVRTPLYYPDAVTLVPGLDAAEVLAGIDDSPGCSVKDSFADLDLSAHGFEVLFEAEWIARPGALPPPPADELEWRPVYGYEELKRWEAAWSGAEPTGLFAGDLLLDESVVMLMGLHGERIAAGAVLNLHAGVAGLSNVFGGGAWAGAIRRAAAISDEAVIVGYESGEDLDAALAVGFRSLGPLRIWLRA